MGSKQTIQIRYMWIDKRKNEEDFQNDYNYIFENNECLLFDNVDKAIRQLIQEESFEFNETIIIISGGLFLEFYKIFTEKLNLIKVSPVVVIFSWEKEYVLSNLKFNGISLNRNSFNEDFVFTQPKDLSNFIKGIQEVERENITFDQIQNINELILPCYYSYLVEDTTKTEIDFYNQNIILNFHDEKKEKAEKKIKAMVKHLKRSNFDFKALISKYWLRIYTMETNFYSQMNKTLREQDENHINSEPLIKICYEGIRKKFFEYEINKKLYRGQLISKKEIQNCLTLKKKRDKHEIEKIIIYCR